MTELKKRPVALIILDGYGLNDETENNAVYAAQTPNLDRLGEIWPQTRIFTSGHDVGLPDGQMGNSEVGHTNIGAGRIVYQDLTRISKAIDEGDFAHNAALLQAVVSAKQNGGALHLCGLLSDGGVHSSMKHLFALLDLAKEHHLDQVYVHCFYDGRDVPPTSGKGYTQQLQEKLSELNIGRIATISGRYYAMDRDNRWERVQLAYDAMTLGNGQTGSDPLEVIQASYDAGVTDEFIIPTTMLNVDGTPLGLVKNGDSMIFFNFRPDRARELTRAFKQPDFEGFESAVGRLDLMYVTMTEYDRTFEQFPKFQVAYQPESLTNTFGEYISELGLRQLRIAETEKYAHVTFFFNGGVEKENPGEDRALLPSPKVATYDLLPEMSAPAVTEELLARLESNQYDVIICNYANCDMVGHTGVFEAAVKAVEAVDLGVGQVVAKIIEMGGVALITADHGNAEKMWDDVINEPFTAHTTFPVRLIVAGQPAIQLKEGRLADLAPTMLDLMGLPQPPEMTGTSLIVRD